MTSLNARVHATVTKHCPDADLILTMLGITNEAGELLPDDLRDYPINALDTAPGVKPVPQSDPRVKPRESSAPDALRVLPPIEAPRKPRSAAQKVGPPQEHNNARRQPCGTEAAARRHVYYGETENGKLLCAECQAGRDARRGTARRHKPGLVNRCGSRTGYDDHKALGTPVCGPCREAANAQARARYARLPKATKEPSVLPVCGTPAGRSAHRRRGEKQCEPCKAVRNSRDVARNQRKKETAQ